MALVLETNYAKKLGLPGYSSHQFAVTVRQEIGSADDVPDAVARMYATLQDSVDREIQQTGWLPDNGNGQPGAQNGNGHYAPADPDPAWNCTIRQRKLIERMCAEQSILDSELGNLAHNRYGKAPCELTKLEASGIISELLADSPRSRNGRYSGNGNGRPLKAESVGKETCP